MRRRIVLHKDLQQFASNSVFVPFIFNLLLDYQIGKSKLVT